MKVYAITTANSKGSVVLVGGNTPTIYYKKDEAEARAKKYIGGAVHVTELILKVSK